VWAPAEARGRGGSEAVRPACGGRRALLVLCSVFFFLQVSTVRSLVLPFLFCAACLYGPCRDWTHSLGPPLHRMSSSTPFLSARHQRGKPRAVSRPRHIDPHHHTRSRWPPSRMGRSRRAVVGANRLPCPCRPRLSAHRGRPCGLRVPPGADP